MDYIQYTVLYKNTFVKKILAEDRALFPNMVDNEFYTKRRINDDGRSKHDFSFGILAKVFQRNMELLKSKIREKFLDHYYNTQLFQWIIFF